MKEELNRICWIYATITYFVTWSITLISYFLYRTDEITLEQLNLTYNFGALGPFIGALASAKIFYGLPIVKMWLVTLIGGSVL